MAGEPEQQLYASSSTKVLTVLTVLGVFGCPVVFPVILALVSGTRLVAGEDTGESGKSAEAGKKRHALILMLSLFVLYFHLWLLNIFGSVPAVAMYAVCAVMTAVGLDVSIWAFLRRSDVGISLAGFGMASALLGILLIFKTAELVASRIPRN
jgi:hypothetical protein